jgi:Xaa-Pro aminopeptidase
MTQTIEKYVRDIIERNNLDCYILFNSDCHLNEYIGPKDKRVALISGFEGSNATVVIGSESCLITDSRYFIQAQKESKFELYKEALSDFISLKKHKRISFDTRTVSFLQFEKILEKTSAEFISTDFDFEIPTDESINLNVSNNSDVIYLEQHSLEDYLSFPTNKKGCVNQSIVKYLNFMGFHNFQGNLTGSSYKDKISKIRKIIGKNTLIVTELDTICWILNLRGNDIKYNPLFYSYLIIDQKECILFTDRDVKLENVLIEKYENFEKSLPKLKNLPVLISSCCNQFIRSKLNNCDVTEQIRNLQANKNEIELCGMALSYFFDGLALTELFAYISNNSNFTEEDLSEKLDQIKKQFPGYVQPSFETISSSGSNAAIVHHSAGNTIVDKNKVYLLDCGSQYYFGTTDTTRTMFFGKNIPEDLKHDYTLVLKGQLSAMIHKYEKTSKYSEIDLISRSFLKKEDKDFGHATGHGVGHFLCVHEHPPTIHPKSTSEIMCNHVFSIEPGYYKENEYGIRIENLVISRKNENGFKIQNITLVPYQNVMVQLKMLSEEEREFYNASNTNCVTFLCNLLSNEGVEFLKKNCVAI